jgi:hypothetical protein
MLEDRPKLIHKLASSADVLISGAPLARRFPLLGPSEIFRSDVTFLPAQALLDWHRSIGAIRHVLHGKEVGARRASAMCQLARVRDRNPQLRSESR